MQRNGRRFLGPARFFRLTLSGQNVDGGRGALERFAARAAMRAPAMAKYNMPFSVNFHTFYSDGRKTKRQKGFIIVKGAFHVKVMDR